MLNCATRVYIIDDEESVRAAYARLVRSAHMEPKTFASVDEFMQANTDDENACIVSDVWMPGHSGLDLPRLLTDAGRSIPVIFTTAHDTEDTREIAHRAGAAAY